MKSPVILFEFDKELAMEIIASARTDFPTKFGVPRQSGLCDTKARIVFRKKYSYADAVKGLEQFSHIWIIWEFSLSKRTGFKTTVRPPRLGGNKRIGVFATRSPFRPNPIGLSCVKLDRIEYTNSGPELVVSGADMADNTPIYDIKPYLPYTDVRIDAVGGFADEKVSYRLKVECSECIIKNLPANKRESLLNVLSLDPRPSYHNDEARVYGFEYAGYEVKFKVEGDVLRIIDIQSNK